MPPRFLFGPVSAAYAQEHLEPLRAAGTCLAFGGEPGVDLLVGPDATWESIAARLPAGWLPDYLALWLPYTTIPAGLRNAPVPLIGLAADWNLLWHDYRRLLPSCEWAFTDQGGVAALRNEGHAHVSPGRLYGWGAAYAEPTPPEGFRDLDLLFVGNVQPAIQAERLPWLERLARLGPEFRVEIRAGVHGAEYRRLLRRAKLVFNRSIRGELNQRVGEAIACGALLLQEEGNAEVEALLPADAYLAYGETTLEGQVRAALADDAGRCRRVRRAQEFLPALSFAGGWAEMAAEIQERLPALQAKVPTRPRPPALAGRLASPVFMSAEAAVAAAAPAAVVAHAQQGLAELWVEDGAPIDPLWRPGGFEEWRVAWEAAAWGHAGDPAAEAAAKRRLLAWRLHLRLGEAVGDLKHLYEAARRRESCPRTLALLGQRLAAEGFDGLAIESLRAAQAQSPFDGALAQAYGDCLRRLGDQGRWAALAEGRRRLALAAPGLAPWQEWFAPPRPAVNGLASIILPCCGQAELTRACVAALHAHTRPPYELIFVDNGSTDGTAAHLAGLEGGAGADRVVVLRNEANRGFAAACNQGLAAARGEFLVLLNNDTQVTAGWLERLCGLSLATWPTPALVGPMSNYVPSPQLVEWRDEDLGRLEEFAAARAAAHAGQAIAVPRLSGFCLLLRREALARLGPLDEGFGLGFFEDDDWCVRAREAGFPLCVALDAFVYHAGNQTFRGLNLDAEARLRENFARFQAKWGAERCAGYRPPGQAPAAAAQPTEPASDTAALLPGVSVCLIVKDEEANLDACLTDARGLAREIIVVDTGSTDRTKEIALAHGARVFDFPWVDSFAAARNECLRHARHEWIFWLDADDRLDETCRAQLAELFASLPAEPVAFSLLCVCLPDPVSRATTEVGHVRLFRHHPRLRWKYRVHEQILPGLRALGELSIRHLPIRIHHVGYQDPELRARKLDRDLRLLRLEEAEQPDDPFVNFNLGSILLERGQAEAALPHLERSLARSHPADSIVRKLYVLLCQGYRRLGLWRAALPLLQEARGRHPDDAELLFQEGVLQHELGNLAGAERAYRALTTLPPPAGYFASLDAGLVGHLARHNLGVVLLEQEKFAAAEAELRHALSLKPDYLPARVSLAELLLKGGRWPEFEAVLAELRADGAGQELAERLRLRGRLARREYAAARAELEARIAAAPTELWPRELYSHAWLQEGVDWAAAERALLAILALQPDHAEARRNLAVLRERARQA